MSQPKTITIRLPKTSTVAVIILAIAAIPGGFAAKAFMEYKRTNAACVRDFYQRFYEEHKVQPDETTRAWSKLACY